MINLSQIENLSAREGKTLDYSKVKASVTAGLKKSNIIAYTSKELRQLLGIEKEYKNLGAWLPGPITKVSHLIGFGGNKYIVEC